MKQYRVYPYKMGSQGAGKLSEGLRLAGMRCFKVFPDRNYQPRQAHTIINWGNSTNPDWLAKYCNRFPWAQLNILNWPQFVANASNKLKSFSILKDAGDISIPEFTTSRDKAQSWVDEGDIVVCRSLLQGHSGRGIGLVGKDIEDGDHTGYVPPNIPLYVKYIKKKHEYRIHVFKDKVIDIQQKKKRREVPNEDVDYQIRNHGNGWVYCRDDVNPDPSVINNSINAIRALGLDFGAVDVIWNEHHQKAYVLEVNTAPGLDGSTIDNYIDAFKEV